MREKGVGPVDGAGSAADRTVRGEAWPRSGGRGLGLPSGDEELARAGAPGRLVLAADVVSGGVPECPFPAKATSDGRALVFLPEEARCSTGRPRDAVDEPARHLGVRP
jgi:hypothetical protein